jgi:hypothetical protein
LYLPYIYMAYMASGMAWWWTMARRPAESEPLTGSSVQ